MEKLQLVAKTIETAITEDPKMMALIASSPQGSVEIVFETMQAPVIASGILLSSQEAAIKLDTTTTSEGLARNIERSMENVPEAVDISFAADGEVLCINVGSGVLFLKLTDTAKKSLKNLSTL